MLESITCCHGPKGHNIRNKSSPIRACSRHISHFHVHSFNARFFTKKPTRMPSCGLNYWTSHFSFVSGNIFEGKSLLTSRLCGSRGMYMSRHRLGRWERSRLCAAVDVGSAIDVINDLGLDTLTFLGVTVVVVPVFKTIRASPILGFFFAGIVLNQFGLIRNLTDVKVLSEWGILFLLFEMGLELSLARLKALAKYAFGMGLTQVNIRSIDEAVVIGAALSLSSSAFVLQLLAEKGELPTRFGSATLGILLLQDIAVVPLLVILPVLESQNLVEESIWPLLAQESLKALGGLGLLSLGGKYLLRGVFEVVAEARSSEAFVALCLLTVAGTSLLTQKLGFSDTLGAFLAGALLAETNFRTQIEADIRPFRGLLLGLFFVTTGTSIDTQLLFREWPNILSLLAGLIAIKTMIITAIGPRVGLTLQESVRIGLLLSQGGEFAFVVFSLANSLGVLPLELNKLLIIVVVLSMALTPLLNEVGRRAAEFIEDKFDTEDKAAEVNFNVREPIVIVGFGQMGQVLANFLSAPLASGIDGGFVGWPYVAFDLNVSVVKASRKLGFPILYGDGSLPAVLQSASISSPKAFMIMFTGRRRTTEAVQRLRLAFPGIPIYARAQDLTHLLELKKAGTTDAILENAEMSLQLGSKLLKDFGVMSDDVNFLSQLFRDSMELQAQEALSKNDAREFDITKPLQVRVGDSIGAQAPIPSTSSGAKSLSINQTDDSHVLRFQGEADQAAHDSELQEPEDVQGKGVLYCELDGENGFPVGTDDAMVEKNMLDPSAPCMATTEDP
ncbi:K(+) efflux antiporter 3, chloroplastic isoform X2 [Populus alba]|uniref:K(+) efflux antiporter 3, chloroplastic isoform X2 n=1 Tax=Populus alba TaxID=43335 RepID=UPI003CC733D6